MQIYLIVYLARHVTDRYKHPWSPGTNVTSSVLVSTLVGVECGCTVFSFLAENMGHPSK